jgi:hypothetical protein
MDDDLIKEDNNFHKGILDKIQMLKESQNQNIQEFNVSIVKTSNDPDVLKVANLISENYNNNCIGIRKTIKIIQSENTISKISIYDINYLLGRKFRYLKNECLSFGEILVIIINIYDKRYLKYLKIIIDELDKKLDNKGKNTEINKKIVFLIIKTSNNFLLKLTENSALITAKEEISNLFNNIKNFNPKYIDIDINEIDESNNLISDIIS